jgi:hypothetical protein
MRRAFPAVAVGFLALTVLAGAAGHRSFPATAPNDPDYDRWERGVDSSSFYDEQWNLYSFTPRGVPLTRQASGISADLAWKISTGRRDVTIAILDSGIRWHERELVNQFYLNRGELPEPQDQDGHSTPGGYDLNGDGVFNIQDYAADRRFRDVNGNGILDPGDLIALASDGVDSDGNGYVDVTDYAQGVLFAVDSGAQVVAAAVGSVNNTAFARAAVEYAHRKGAVLIASAADENSFHHPAAAGRR